MTTLHAHLISFQTQKSLPPDTYDVDVISSPPPAPLASKPKPKPKVKQGKTSTKSQRATAGPEDEEAASPGSKHRNDDEGDSTDRDDEKTVKKTKKGKAKAGEDVQGDSEVPARKRQPKSKAVREDSDIEVINDPPVARKRKGNEAKKSGKSAERAPSIDIRTRSDDDMEKAPPKKKMRKINVFPPPNDASAFNFMETVRHTYRSPVNRGIDVM